MKLIRDIILFALIVMLAWLSALHQDRIIVLENTSKLQQQTITLLTINQEKLAKTLKAYSSKLNDLSLVWIRHFGEYPRTIVAKN